MSSGVEVMISHAENLTRHLERVREDLNELRLKERLIADEPVTAGTLANGPTRLGNKQRWNKCWLSISRTRLDKRSRSNAGL